VSETPLKDIVPLEEVQLESDLPYEEKPIKILETAERNTRTKTSLVFKIHNACMAFIFTFIALHFEYIFQQVLNLFIFIV
jgi:hypothetical protein